MYLQSIPLSCLPIFTKVLLDKEELKIYDLEEIKDKMPATYTLKKDQGIKSFYDIVINNKMGEPIGFLAVQYTQRFKKSFSDEERTEMLRLKFFIEENLEKMVAKKQGGGVYYGIYYNGYVFNSSWVFYYNYFTYTSI